MPVWGKEEEEKKKKKSKELYKVPLFPSERNNLKPQN